MTTTTTYAHKKGRRWRLVYLNKPCGEFPCTGDPALWARVGGAFGLPPTWSVRATVGHMGGGGVIKGSDGTGCTCSSPKNEPEREVSTPAAQKKWPNKPNRRDRRNQRNRSPSKGTPLFQQITLGNNGVTLGKARKLQLEKRLNHGGICAFIQGILLSMMTRATSLSWTAKRMH